MEGWMTKTTETAKGARRLFSSKKNPNSREIPKRTKAEIFRKVAASILTMSHRQQWKPMKENRRNCNELVNQRGQYNIYGLNLKNDIFRVTCLLYTSRCV